jgi:hypothetical protein
LIWTVAVAPPFTYCVLLAVGFPTSSNPVDWSSYVLGADRLSAGQTPYSPFQLAGPYSFDDVAGGNGFVYPPSAAALMGPFLRPIGLWIAVTLFSYAGGVLAVLRRERAGALLTALLLWAAVLPGFVVDGLRSGAASAGMAGLLAFSYGGVPMAGVAGALKGFPAVWLILDFRRSARRAIAGFIAGIGVPVLISIALAGITPWLDFFVAYGNAQPACGLAPIALPCAGIPRVVLLLAGAAIALGSFRMPTSVALLALGLAVIVAAPEVWDHYWTLVVPGALACIARAVRSVTESESERRVVARAG